MKCPVCGSINVTEIHDELFEISITYEECQDCGENWIPAEEWKRFRNIMDQVVEDEKND